MNLTKTDAFCQLNVTFEGQQIFCFSTIQDATAVVFFQAYNFQIPL